MYIVLMTIAFIFCIVALVVTLMLGKEESKKARDYEKEGHGAQQALARSNSYEKSSLKENLPLLLVIYIATFLVSIGLFLFFLYNPF
ncbi:hypothetical protein [Sediminibacillus massiliensis]|uniref:hypothetical protein n=1 Tax=Sediminibacillus massiliensis TaxID=1926277 RepID=UPI0009886FD6|nr:hypothetical protein [Sediminibacillus massiliensis]